MELWLQSVVLLLTGPSWCAGVLVDPQGTIATSYHCIANGMRPQVELQDGTVLEGTVIARDPDHDLALLTVDAGRVLPALTIRGDDPAIGERVYALGHPFASAATGRYDGLLRWSVSEGIVAARGDWFFQTDAGMNPGNSGGPVVDEHGRVLGITSRKLTGDNIAFVSRGNHLLALLVAPDRGSVFGGTWGVGPAVVQSGSSLYLSGDIWLSIRERVVVRGWVGTTLSPFGSGVAIGTLELRQRVGRGALSSTFDLGVGGLAREERATPVVSGRVGFGNFGFGLFVSPPWGTPGPAQVDLVLDVTLPGVLGVF